MIFELRSVKRCLVTLAEVWSLNGMMTRMMGVVVSVHRTCSTFSTVLGILGICICMLITLYYFSVIGESVHAVLTALNITAENVPQQNKIDKQKDIHLKVESDIR